MLPVSNAHPIHTLVPHCWSLENRRNGITSPKFSLEVFLLGRHLVDIMSTEVYKYALVRRHVVRSKIKVEANVSLAPGPSSRGLRYLPNASA